MSVMADLRAVGAGVDFRRLFRTRLVSQVGDGAFQVGLASLIFFSPERQATPTAVAGAFTLLLLPYSVVGPFAGVLLDRWRRQQILVWSNTLRAALVVGVASLIAAGVVGPPLYAVVLACLSVNRFFLSGLSAALPHVVPADELVMANSVTTTLGSVAALVGAGAGYGMKSLLGAGDSSDAQVILVSAFLYALSAVLAARMDRDLLGPDEDPDRPVAREAVRHVLAGMADGARHVASRRPASHALAAITAHRFAYGNSLIAVILLYRNHFHSAADTDAGLRGLAGVFGASGVGFLAAAVITPAVTRRITKASWIVVCLLASAAVDYGYLVVLSQPLVVAGAFLIGAAAQGSKICIDTIVQESVDDAYRGRVFAFYDVLFNMAFVSACAFAALVVPTDGDARLVYGVIATVYLLTAAGYAVATRRLRPSPRAAEPATSDARA